MQTKKVSLDLTKCDGNAFALMGAFNVEAIRAGWTREEINSILNECMSGDYDNLVRVLSSHCK